MILRHKPQVIGITLDEHGWADVDELIKGINETGEEVKFSKDTLEIIVKTDKKQRYSFSQDKTLIRANQGHSIPVDVELEKKEPPKVLYPFIYRCQNSHQCWKASWHTCNFPS